MHVKFVCHGVGVEHNLGLDIMSMYSDVSVGMGSDQFLTP